MHALAYLMEYLIYQQTLFVAWCSRSQYQLNILSELLGDIVGVTQTPEAKIWHAENNPRLELCFGPKRTKAKRSDATQVRNWRPFHGRHRDHVTLLSAHKTNVKREAERARKLPKCLFTDVCWLLKNNDFILNFLWYCYIWFIDNTTDHKDAELISEASI